MRAAMRFSNLDVLKEIPPLPGEETLYASKALWTSISWSRLHDC
jgi:hypothetical protein